MENEKTHVWNLNNGNRLVTYAIRAKRGNRIISANGSAARRVAEGDLVIVAAFARFSDQLFQGHKPTLVYIQDSNQIAEVRSTVPIQLFQKPAATTTGKISVLHYAQSKFWSRDPG